MFVRHVLGRGIHVSLTHFLSVLTAGTTTRSSGRTRGAQTHRQPHEHSPRFPHTICLRISYNPPNPRASLHLPKTTDSPPNRHDIMITNTYKTWSRTPAHTRDARPVPLLHRCSTRSTAHYFFLNAVDRAKVGSRRASTLFDNERHYSSLPLSC